MRCLSRPCVSKLLTAAHTCHEVSKDTTLEPVQPGLLRGQHNGWRNPTGYIVTGARERVVAGALR